MIKKYFSLNIIIFLCIFLIISGVILTRPLNNLDEIWNYNFARNIADGKIAYRDFNMLQTPLLPFICGLVLKLFGNELFTMRILAIILISGLFFLIYKILKKLNVNNYYSFVCLFLLFLLLKDYICIDYNFAVLFFVFILIYLDLIKNNNLENEDFNYKKINLKNKKEFFYYFIFGIISGSCFLFKQSTGVLICIVTIFYPLLFVRNKNDLKNYLKISLIKILGILIPIILLLVYLIINNAFYDFIDYAILGIKTFSNSIPYSNLVTSQNLIIKLSSIGLPILIALSAIYLLIKNDRKLYCIYFYSLANLIVIYPISDNVHFLIGICPFLVLIFYFIFKLSNYLINKINKLIKNKLNKNNNLFKLLLKIKLFFICALQCCIILLLAYTMFISCTHLNNYFINTEKDHQIAHFKNIPISSGLQNNIKVVNEYILNERNDVYIIDSDAATYMIPLNRYTKDFDMFLKGNLGSKSEQGQIEKIKKLKSGTKLLIKNNSYSKNWQTPLDAIYFIENNYSKVGEVGIFDIYEI